MAGHDLKGHLSETHVVPYPPPAPPSLYRFPLSPGATPSHLQHHRSPPLTTTHLGSAQHLQSLVSARILSRCVECCGCMHSHGAVAPCLSGRGRETLQQPQAVVTEGLLCARHLASTSVCSTSQRIRTKGPNRAQLKSQGAGAGPRAPHSWCKSDLISAFQALFSQLAFPIPASPSFQR